MQRTQLVRSILLGKLANSKLFLMRQRRERPGREAEITPAIERLTEAARRVQDCPSVDSMRALEGVAAAAYFSAMPAMLDGSKFQFSGKKSQASGRTWSMPYLSFLYTLLKNDVQSALEGVGLDPAAGFLHTLRPGRPALALDLMEELRAPLCDRLMLALIHRGQISEKSFDQLTAPVLLSEAGRKAVVAAWQKRKQETITHPFLGEKIPVGLIPTLRHSCWHVYCGGRWMNIRRLFGGEET